MELILTSFLTISCYGQPNDLKAKTEDGKEVLLRTDGTWSFVGEYKKKKNAPLCAGHFFGVRYGRVF